MSMSSGRRYGIRMRESVCRVWCGEEDEEGGCEESVGQSGDGRHLCCFEGRVKNACIENDGEERDKERVL